MVHLILTISSDQFEQLHEAKTLMEKKLKRSISFEDAINFLAFAYTVTQEKPYPDHQKREVQMVNLATEYYNPN